ncbi:MAG: hypothetical protein IJ667_07990 [Synergistaceae bacterium]|nr:hypothetical protein [Synergistaceae bacterium]
MDINTLGSAQSLLALTQVQAQNASFNSNSSSSEVKIETDSYSKSEAFPIVSGLYNQSGQEAETIKPVAGSGTAEQSGAKPAGGGAPAGSGSDDDEDSETVTQIITINGVSYLETRTTSNGIETVTRKMLG